MCLYHLSLNFFSMASNIIIIIIIDIRIITGCRTPSVIWTSLRIFRHNHVHCCWWHGLYEWKLYHDTWFSSSEHFRKLPAKLRIIPNVHLLEEIQIFPLNRNVINYAIRNCNLHIIFPSPLQAWQFSIHSKFTGT